MEPNIISWSQIRKEFMLREESGCAEKTEDLHLPRMFVYQFKCFWIKAFILTFDKCAHVWLKIMQTQSSQ